MSQCAVDNLKYIHVSERQSAFIFYGLPTLKIKALYSFKTRGYVKLPTTQHNIPGVWNPQHIDTQRSKIKHIFSLHPSNHITIQHNRNFAAILVPLLTFVTQQTHCNGYAMKYIV
jgi:hypothetical protein